VLQGVRRGAGRAMGRRVELILLNATREPLQRDRAGERDARAVPVCSRSNKRCFHPRDVVKLLSRAIPPRPLHRLHSPPLSGNPYPHPRLVSLS